MNIVLLSDDVHCRPSTCSYTANVRRDPLPGF